MTDPRSTLELFVTDQISVWDVIGWASAMLAELSPNTNAALERLAELDPRNSTDSSDEVLRHLVSLIPDANPFTPDEIKITSDAKQLLNRQLAPVVFCQRVQHLDSKWADSDLYPVWLAELWNACDWCDKTWTLETAPWLKKIAEELVTRQNGQ